MHQNAGDGIVDYIDAFSPVPAASGFRTILRLTKQQNMFNDHVHISQAFVQGELLPGHGHNGKVCISSPPGYDKGPLMYGQLKSLYSMPSAARAWYTMMRALLAKEGCATVEFGKSMWTITIDGAHILLSVFVDDFVIAKESLLRCAGCTSICVWLVCDLVVMCVQAVGDRALGELCVSVRCGSVQSQKV